MRVLRITHDKGWINDDDPGSASPGWLRKSNLGTGDYNNDLTTSTTVGDVWTSTFTGTSVAVYAPKEPGDGKIEIQIDGQVRATADLSTTGARQPQQMVARGDRPDGGHPRHQHRQSWSRTRGRGRHRRPAMRCRRW